MFRRGMVLLLRNMAGIQVVFECSNGEELLARLRSSTIDIVLLDLEMPVNRRHSLHLRSESRWGSSSAGWSVPPDRLEGHRFEFDIMGN
jgi:DNA-binding NarL/FixJ family response regulator